MDPLGQRRGQSDELHVATPEVAVYQVESLEIPHTGLCQMCATLHGI